MIAVSLGLGAGRSSAAASTFPTRTEIVEHWAPTFYQETRDHRDLLAAFDFDGDWDLSNNAAHVATHALRAVVNYRVVETPTHWLITYLPYHPIDAKRPSGHDHDTEHAELVVRKDGGRFGRLEVVETRFHHVYYQYAASRSGVRDGADNIDGPIHYDPATGRPAIYAQRVGHGLCGGFAPTARFDPLALYCAHDEAPHIAHQGIVYRFRGRAETPRSLDDRDVGYALVEIGQSLWPRVRDIGPHAVFATIFDFTGDRCALFRCPRGIGEMLSAPLGHSTTGMLWEESPGRGGAKRGESFFDPAYVLSRRLHFPEPFALTYIFNPYLGIGGFAPPTSDTHADAQSSHVQPVE